MEQHADYGYDAPYALVTFAALGATGVTASIVSWWEGNGRRRFWYGNPFAATSLVTAMKPART
jgi:hypothetical protein